MHPCGLQTQRKPFVCSQIGKHFQCYCFHTPQTSIYPPRTVTPSITADDRKSLIPRRHVLQVHSHKIWLHGLELNLCKSYKTKDWNTIECLRLLLTFPFCSEQLGRTPLTRMKCYSVKACSLGFLSWD